MEKVGVVAFSFGAPAHTSSNQFIAHHTMALIDTEPTAVLYTDREIVPHLTYVTAAVATLDPSLYPSTYRLALFAIKEAKKRDLSTLVVVAAPYHVWRCLRDVRWAAEANNVDIKLVARPADGCPFDSAAATWYARAAWLWWPLELCYRLGSSSFPGLYKQLRS